MIQRYLILLGLLVFAVGCNSIPDDVQEAINQTHVNRRELSKVIEHYQQTGERKKLKAAFFLIRNMPGKFSETNPYSSDLFRIGRVTDSLKKAGNSREIIDSCISKHLQGLKEEMFETRKPVERAYDLDVMTSDYLIKNINLAFKAWELPWARHLTFNQFCEYLLPYRVNEEPLGNWREYFMNKFMYYKDSVKDASDPREMAMLLSNHLYRRWTHSDSFDNFPIYPDAVQLYKDGIGMCDQRYYLMTCMLRSMGVACAIDFTPQWQTWHGGHSWISIIDKDGKSSAFNAGEDNACFKDKNLVPMGSATVVYRKYFNRINPDAPVGNLPALLTNQYVKNVSDEYEYPQNTLTIHLESKDEADFIVLCCFNYGYSNTPVICRKVKSKKVVFENLGIPAVYIPVMVKNNQLKYMKPYLLRKDGEIKKYGIDPGSTHDIKVYRKYPSSGEFIDYGKGMIGAKIQVSNKADFSDAVDILTIKADPEYFESVTVEKEADFRYIRYKGSDSSDIRIAEVEFFDEFDKPLLGKVFCQLKGKDKYESVPENAFDMNIETNFNAVKGSWVAMDLRTRNKRKIQKINYVQRNNMNFVVQGNTYELLYLDNNNNWISCGKQEATSNFVYYKNIPKGALLLLKNLSTGKQERVFICEGNNQWFM
jgi:hypothetical protein